MGTTAASLHVLFAPNVPASSFASAIGLLYRKSGFGPATKKRPAEKRVIVTGGGSSPYFSIYDSQNDRIDTGELKSLAVACSKRFFTVAIVTSVYDSDSFEFIVYQNGKQIDAAVSDPENHSGNLKMLAGKRRAKVWHDLFARRPALAAPLEEWERRISGMHPSDSVFAETDLARWCELAGLSADRAMTIVDDFGKSGPVPHETLELIATKRAAAQPKTAAGGAEQTFEFTHDDEDLPEHRVFPAAWPVLAAKPHRVQWAAVTSGPGFTGLRVDLSFERTTGVRLYKATLAALPFFNGQVTSMKGPKHVWSWEPDGRRIDTPSETWEAGDFAVPYVDPESRRRFIALLQLTVVLEDGADVTIHPSFATVSSRGPQMTLPPARLAACPIQWRTLWSGTERTADTELLELNASAIESCVGLLGDNGQPQRAQAAALVEAWLSSMRLPPGTLLSVETEKHMSPSANISKSKWSLSPGERSSDSRWAKLFDVERDYQTITVSLTPPGFAYPQTGAVVQSSLRAFARRGDEALNCALWIVNEPEVFTRFGTSLQQTEEIFRTWLTAADIDQAWIAGGALIPDFGRYESWGGMLSTPYERAAAKLTTGALNRIDDRASNQRRLRNIAPLMWLGESLSSAVDSNAAARSAAIAKAGNLTEIRLKGDATLNDLESALAPILPIAPID